MGFTRELISIVAKFEKVSETAYEKMIFVPHRPAGKDDIRNLSFAFGGIWREQRLPQPAQQFGRIVFIEQRGPNRIFSNWTDAVAAILALDNAVRQSLKAQ